MRCYVKSSTSSRVHSQEADDKVDSLAEGISEFHDQFEALFKRYGACGRSSTQHVTILQYWLQTIRGDMPLNVICVIASSHSARRRLSSNHIYSSAVVRSADAWS